MAKLPQRMKILQCVDKSLWQEHGDMFTSPSTGCSEQAGSIENTSLSNI